jgi:hypothetical protein
VGVGSLYLLVLVLLESISMPRSHRLGLGYV